MTKHLMVFRPSFIEFSRGWPPVDGGWKGPVTLTTHAIRDFVTLPMQRLACCKTQYRGCSCCQNTVVSFCLPQLLSKEHCISISPTKRLGTLRSGKQVTRSSTPISEKEPHLGYRKWTVAKTSAAVTPVLEMQRIMKKMVSPLRVKILHSNSVVIDPPYMVISGWQLQWKLQPSIN